MSLSRKPRLWFLATTGVIAAAVMVVSGAVLLPFVFSIILAYLLSPAVSQVERLRLPRWGAILLVYALTLGALTAFFWAIVPRLANEVRSLTVELPRLKQHAVQTIGPAIDRQLAQWTGGTLVPRPTASAALGEDESPKPNGPAMVVRPRLDGSYEIEVKSGLQIREASGGSYVIEPTASEKKSVSVAVLLSDGMDRFQQYARENSGVILQWGRAVVGAVSRGIFSFFLSLMLAAYLMLTRERIFAFFRELWHPADREAFDRFFRRLDRGLSGVVRGQLMICVVNGILTAIGFAFFGLKYWPLLSLVAGIMSVVPIFGSILSSIPAVAIGLTQSPFLALCVLAWIVGIHQLEANVLNPKIIGDSAKIHPVLVVLSLLIGEHFFQITGALLAVPVMSIIQTIFLHFRESTLGLPNPLASILPPAGGMDTVVDGNSAGVTKRSGPV